MWLGVCFGTIVVGVLLLIFAPRILFFPFNFFLVIGLGIMGGLKYKQSANFKYQSGSYGQNGSFSNANSLNQYYEELQSSKTDSFDVIKKNYRRLMKEYHYDSIASQDLPPHMIKLAEEKTKSLNEAYSAIKEARA